MKKHLRIRITEEQFKKLADQIIREEISKSKLIRNMMDKYLDETCRTPRQDGNDV
jgi:hypothetical protein